MLLLLRCYRPQTQPSTRENSPVTAAGMAAASTTAALRMRPIALQQCVVSKRARSQYRLIRTPAVVLDAKVAWIRKPCVLLLWAARGIGHFSHACVQLPTIGRPFDQIRACKRMKRVHVCMSVCMRGRHGVVGSGQINRARGRASPQVAVSPNAPSSSVAAERATIAGALCVVAKRGSPCRAA